MCSNVACNQGLEVPELQQRHLGGSELPWAALGQLWEHANVSCLAVVDAGRRASNHSVDRR